MLIFKELTVIILSGFISIKTDIIPTFISWYHFDDSGDSTQVNFYSDSLSTNECGKYRVQIYGSTGKYY